MESHSDRSKNPASLICFRYTGQAATSIPELKSYKNLVILTQAELDLSDNCIEQEIKELSTLKYLKKLSLSGNHISALWSLPKTLEYLYLSCNHISTIASLNLPRLLLLDLSCNLIANLDYFIELSHLRSLYLGYNLIRDLSKLREMKTLQEIDLEHNLIDSVDSMNHLIEADLLVFVIKKNPATR